MNWKCIRNRIKGQSLVEFALVLPILLIVVFGIVDLSRLTYHKTMMNEAAREGIRAACVGSDLNTVALSISNLIQPLAGNVTYTFSAGTDETNQPCTIITFSPESPGYQLIATISPVYSDKLKTGDVVKMTLVYRMNYVTPMINFFGNTADLSSTFYARMESPPL